MNEIVVSSLASPWFIQIKGLPNRHSRESCHSDTNIDAEIYDKLQR